MNAVRGLSGIDVLLEGVGCQGWWLFVEADDAAGRIVAGPFTDRADAAWAAATEPRDDDAQPTYGVRRADGGLKLRQSPQDRAWLAHLDEQLTRLPEGWDADLDEEDPLVTLVVEVTQVLAEAGLSLHDPAAPGVGGACLTPEPALGGIVVTWRQYDRASVDQLPERDTDPAIQVVMNRALGDVLVLGGFSVETFPDTRALIIRFDT